MTATNPAIEVSGLTKSYGDHSVLDGVDLTVPEGTLYALLGPNGAGKTTVVTILSTLLTPGDGEIRVAGSTYDANPPACAPRSAVVVAPPRDTEPPRSAYARGGQAGPTPVVARQLGAKSATHVYPDTAALKRSRRPEGLSGGSEAYPLRPYPYNDLAMSLVIAWPPLFHESPTTPQTRSLRRTVEARGWPPTSALGGTHTSPSWGPLMSGE